MSRNQIISLVFVSVLIGLFIIRSYNSQKYIVNYGFIQGTTYNIKYKHNEDIQNKIDSVLHQFDLSLSTYIPNSIISKFNQNDSFVIADEYFTRFFKVAMDVSEQTKGAFDITVAPIVNAWGFGFTEKQDTDSLLIDSLIQFTGYKKLKLLKGKIIKTNPGIMLDGNAIAQGQSVDVIADFLLEQGIENFLVDIGGEIKTKGKNPDNNIWRVGIDKPIENSSEIDRQLQAIINISDKSLATSGNYRKFYEKDGVKYSHTIDPQTGYPVHHNLLSATVITDDCIYADAYATAFMVMGLEKAKLFLEENKNIEAYLIYSDEHGNYKVFYTEGLSNLIESIE